MALFEQNKSDEEMMKLVEEHKREKELLHKRIIELEAKLDEKQGLELELERMRGAVEVMKQLSGTGKKLELMKERLMEKEDEFESLLSINQNIVIRERITMDELREARKMLIKALKDTQLNICVKMMGRIDTKAFTIPAKRKYRPEDVDTKALELCFLWMEYLMDPIWNPFKEIMVGENLEEVVDEDDKKLKKLKSKFGNQVYKDAIIALNEINEYNPSLRYPVPELWNASENRKTSFGEAIQHILQQWKLNKDKISMPSSEESGASHSKC